MSNVNLGSSVRGVYPRWRYAYFTADPAGTRANVRGYIAGELPDGLLTVNSVPGSREILLMHRFTRQVVDYTWSDTNGTYKFRDLPVDEEFDVIARDWQRAWGDVIAYAVKPLPY